MLVLADQATNQTIALLITFVGIGVLVNILVIYIIAQVLAERRENQERQQRLNR
jgi:phage shock protein PspC (stress-responsive transcriptional regulator)